MVRNPRSHSWSYSQGLIDSRKVVPHECDIQKMNVVRYFLGVRIREAGKASVHHADVRMVRFIRSA